MFAGDVILSTPSLESYRVTNDPLYRYEGHMSARRSNDVDHRILSYNSLEHRRYQSLRMKQPGPRYVSRIFEERCKRTYFHCLSILLLFVILVGPIVSPRTDPSKTIRLHTAPGYRLLVEQIPNQDETMVSQRFNKLSPFVTEHGNNPVANPVLRETVA